MNSVEGGFAPVPLAEVEVTDAYCKNAMEKEAEYLLSLQEGRLLAGFCRNAGLETAYVRYGGWESGLIGGHTLGHYLMALSQGAAEPALGEETRARLLRKAKNILGGLLACQKAVGSGLIWGAPSIEGGIEAQFDNVERGKTNIRTEAWVPWYTLHKLLAGLVGCYELTACPEALELASRLGDWVYARVSRWDDAVRRQVLSVEYGGMNDCLYELYSLTGKAEHAAAAHVFDEEELFDDILSGKKDALDGLHANTTIPKFIGALNRYLVLHGRELGGERVDASRYLRAAAAFFRKVTEEHTYATGGNSEWEHFGKDGVLDAERTAFNCETCNVYNMMKLARGLFRVTGDKRYSDYYDNAFTNAILASQNPETGMTTYFQPMASGYFKVFSSREQDFWCCTGTGMENFTKLGDGIFYTRGETLFVERYLSSVYSGKERKVSLRCGAPFAAEAALCVERAAEPFMLCLRVPDWAAGYPSVKKNGAPVRVLEGNGHVSLAVKEGDVVERSLPIELRMKGLPDGKDAFCFSYGNVLLSADCGAEEMTETTTGEAVRVPAAAHGAPGLLRVHDLYALFEEPSSLFEREGETFLLQAEPPVRFSPHFKRYRERYALYVRLVQA